MHWFARLLLRKNIDDAGDAGDADEDEVVGLAWEDGGGACEPNSHVSLFN